MPSHLKTRNEMLKKPAKERVEKMVDKCKCHGCLSWVECGERGAYCLPGSEKSRCIKSEQGCLCVCCPVQTLMDYRHTFYCLYGNDKAQRTGKSEVEKRVRIAKVSPSIIRNRQ